MNKRIGRLHVLTDFHLQQRFAHVEIARQAIRGGADTIQFRQKSVAIRHTLVEAERTVRTCRKGNTPLIVNDRVDIALACGADGVHLGQTDLPILVARRVMGPDAIVGGTATTLEEAREAREAGADYIGFGPVFHTSGKRNPACVKGLARLGSVCAGLDVPVIAIGGITADRIGPVIRAGAYGVGVMTAVTMAESPVKAVRAIRDALDVVLSLTLDRLQKPIW